MKNRFEKKDRRFGGAWQSVLPAATFVLVFAFVLAGIRSVGRTTDEQEIKSLETAVRNSAVECYALEGRYPESLSYLKEHYGITYDESRYMVSYQAYGANLLPTVTVLPLQGGAR